VRGLATIAIKCVGVFVMVATLGLVQTAVMWTFAGPGTIWVNTLFVWAAALAQLLVGLALVLRGGKLAARWFDDSPLGSPPQAPVLLRLALLVAGVVLVALAVPGLCQTATYGVVESSSGDGLGMTTQVSWDWLNWLHGGVYPLVELVVGVLLVAFSERLSRRLWREAPAASAGQALPEDAPQAPVSPDEA
jgi:hypothetical protein